MHVNLLLNDIIINTNLIVNTTQIKTKYLVHI